MYQNLGIDFVSLSKIWRTYGKASKKYLWKLDFQTMYRMFLHYRHILFFLTKIVLVIGLRFKGSKSENLRNSPRTDD